MQRISQMVFVVAASFALTTMAAAQTADSQAARSKVDSDKQITRISSQENAIMSSDAFVQSHPDILFLRSGIEYYQNKEYAKALRHFDLSAGYGEKIAQAMLAEMYWNGMGTEVNRPRAYALIDIAAERGTNPDLITIRERYWNSLTESERQSALSLGDEIVAKYSDEAALKKLAIAFRTDEFSRMRISPGLIQQFVVNGYDGAEDYVRADQFYASKFWEPKEYLKIRDDLTNRILRNGHVKVQFSGKVDPDAKREEAKKD